MSTLPATSAARRPYSMSGIRPVMAVVAGAALMALAAHVAVPFWPVPLTLQSLVALGLGAVLGPAAGVAAICAWIVAGLAELPVFAGGVGPAVLFGPTGGYIVGFLPVVVLSGVAARRGWLSTASMAFLAFLLADAALFAVGVAWLAVLVGWRHAIAGGLTPFLLGEALKIGVAAAGASLLAERRARRT